MVRALLLSLFAPLLFAQSVVAQTPSDDVVVEPDRVVVRKVTALVFTDAEIDAAGVRPGGCYLKGRQKVRFRNLIELRGNFRPELSRSTTSVR